MQPDQLLERVADCLAESPSARTVTVESVRPAGARSAELKGAWRNTKYGSDTRHIEGVFPLDIEVSESGSDLETLRIVLKARTGAGIGRTLIPEYLDRAGVTLSKPYDEFATAVEFLDSGMREIAAYGLQRQNHAYRAGMPASLGAHVDGDEYFLVLERVDDAVLMDSADDVGQWTGERIETSLAAAAEMHAVWYGRVDALGAGIWPAHAFAGDGVLGDVELWVALAELGRRRFPDWVGEALQRRCHRLIESLSDWYRPKSRLARTLVHNDFNSRNTCFRADGRALVYDWELALVDVPQRDLVELLTFTLAPDVGREAVDSHVEFHRQALQRSAQIEVDRDAWWEGFRIELRFEAINRLAYQWLFRTAITLGYTERITHTIQRLLALYG